MLYEVILLEGYNNSTEIYICAEVDLTHEPAEYEHGCLFAAAEWYKTPQRYYTKIGNEKEGFREFPLDTTTIPPPIWQLYEQIIEDSNIDDAIRQYKELAAEAKAERIMECGYVNPFDY